MTWFEYHNAGNSEAQQMQATSFLFTQASTGKAATGVLVGLGVTQTATASGSVVVGAGSGVVQAATLDGASLVGDVQDTTLDVLVASPMGSVPRNDIVIADRATGSIRVLIGSPNVTPADPTVPSSALPLARIRNAANATTVPSSAIDDLRVTTTLNVPPPPTPTWTSFTPTWAAAGTGLAIGSGSLTGRYLDVAKVRHVHIELSRGSDSNFGSGDYTFSYPTTGVDSSAYRCAGSAWYFRTAGGTEYGGTAYGVSLGQVAILADGGTRVGSSTFTGGTPWGTGGRMVLDFTVKLA
jgi:hypothetical protein